MIVVMWQTLISHENKQVKSCQLGAMWWLLMLFQSVSVTRLVGDVDVP